eukprot:TRINITY_DN21641_c0_g1_i1.p1 TRINITY_DN21641_c0_g1~~TRINITY_DN21641_c0_g1_i1.p1  ORF type:complete len:382 (-),score=79.78 TRINITY_DN21641_c0_g1_i1:65-1210(-)
MEGRRRGPRQAAQHRPRPGTPTILQRLGFQPMPEGGESHRIPKIQMLFVSSVLLFCVMQISFSSWLLAQNIGHVQTSSGDVLNSSTYPRADNSGGDDQSVFLTKSHAREFALIVIYVTIALVFFAIDAVWLGSVYEYHNSVFTSIVLTTYVMYSFFIPNKNLNIPTGVEISWAACTGLFQLGFIAGFYFMGKSFIFRAFRQVGANQEMQAMFKTLLICESLMKIDAIVAFLLMLMSFLYLDNWSSIAGITIAAAMFTIAWTVSLFSSIRREDKCLMTSVFVCCVFQPGYVIYKLVDLRVNPNHYSTVVTGGGVRGFEEFLIIGIWFVINRIALMYFAWRSWANFGKGLRNKVFLRSAAASVTDVNGDPVLYDSIPQGDNST